MLSYVSVPLRACAGGVRYTLAPPLITKRCTPQYLPAWETKTAEMMTATQNPLWVLPQTMMMNRWQQNPCKDVHAKAKSTKKNHQQKGKG